jgi:hypothetical protein
MRSTVFKISLCILIVLIPSSVEASGCSSNCVDCLSLRKCRNCRADFRLVTQSNGDVVCSANYAVSNVSISKCSRHCVKNGCAKYGHGRCDALCERPQFYRLNKITHKCVPRCGLNCYKCRKPWKCRKCGAGYRRVKLRFKHYGPSGSYKRIKRTVCIGKRPTQGGGHGTSNKTTTTPRAGVTTTATTTPKSGSTATVTTSPAVTTRVITTPVTSTAVPGVESTIATNEAPTTAGATSPGAESTVAATEATTATTGSVTTSFPCDQNCDPSVGCIVQGAGNCDGNCTSGFGPTNTSTCGACDSHCDMSVGCNIQGAGLCDDICTSNFGLTSNFTCEACDSNCNLTVGCNTKGAGLCDRYCNLGYGPTDSFNCGACDPFCATYNDTSLATGCNVYNATRCDEVCKANYIIDEPTHFCASCDEFCTPTLPASCSTYGTCNGTCVGSHAVNTLTNQCEACDPKCTGGCNANGPGFCDEGCQPNYVYDNQTKRCFSCDLNCAGTCSDAGLCTGSCNPGFGPTPTGNCGECDTNCNSGCKANGYGRCDGTCVDGFALDSLTLTCKACQGLPQCNGATCTSPGTCESNACVTPAVFSSTTMTCY